MSNIRHRLIGAAAATVAAGALAVSGVAVASAASHPARPAASGIEQFQLMNASPTSSTPSIIAHGVFTAGGVDHQGKLDRVVFPNGTFTITHKKGTGTSHFNKKTCLMTISQTGTYTLSGGTGAYAGISGHGTYRLSILAVGARSGGTCSETAPPVAFQQLIRASGPVHL